MSTLKSTRGKGDMQFNKKNTTENNENLNFITFGNEILKLIEETLACTAENIIAH